MLEIEKLAVSYGKHIALHDIGLVVGKGETVVILGANGAGKSSLIKAICGMVPARGESAIRHLGKSLIGLPAHGILEAGIATVPEGRGIFGDLTVDENLQIGAYVRRARQGEAKRRALVFELFPRLAERRRQTASTMSGGEQQMLAIGRALMSDPTLLMLDEPSLGLAPVLVQELFAALSRIRETGVGLMIVEQNVRISLSIADRGYLMEAGRVVGQGSATELIEDPQVQRAFLGMAATAQ